MIIKTQAPVRIDLAGGTLDIWPLFLMIPNALTVNLGIDLFANVKLEALAKRPKKAKADLIFRSEDQDQQALLSWGEFIDWTPPNSLVLHTRLLRFFIERFPKRKPSFLSVTTKAESPAGAGLGGSSALNVALTGAYASLFLGRSAATSAKKREQLIDVVRDVETQVLGVPAGLQDYFGAMYGGLQSIHWRAGTHSRKSFNPKLARAFEKRLLLFYSGQSRNSGINNWQLFKSFIDHDVAVMRRFNSIAKAAFDLEMALAQTNWNLVRAAIQSEWAARRELGPLISTPEMDQAHEAAQQIAHVAFKVCGAGGGGCFFVLLESDDPGVRRKVERAILESSPQIRALKFNVSTQGLRVR